MVRIDIDMTDHEDADDDVAIAAAEGAGATLVGGGSTFDDALEGDDAEIGRDLEFECAPDRVHMVLAALEEAGFRGEALPEHEPEHAFAP